jgi:hypothetical protein
MVFKELLEEIKQYCKSGAIISKEGTVFTTSENGLAISGEECLNLQNMIKEEKNISSLIIESVKYDYKTYEKDSQIYTYTYKDSTLYVMCSKLLIILATFEKESSSENINKVKFIHQDLRYRGL